ncbi:hypothetical protein TYRP_003737, partial [Tyrophagus putrescentiae]
TSPLDQHQPGCSSMESDNSLEKPPTYEESAKDLGPIVVTTPAIFEQMITCPPTTSIDANGSITISMDKLPSSASISNISGGGEEEEEEEMAEEVTALQRAYIHLYKRVHHFKSQMWYAGLAFVTLFLGFLLFFLAAYHPGHSQSAAVLNNGQSAVTAVASHRTGKALVGGGGKALDLVASNALDGDHPPQNHHQDDTELLLKHLSRIASTTTMTTSAAALGKQDTLATSELFVNGQKISSSVDSNGILQTAESNIHSEQTVKVMEALPSSSSSTSSTSTTTMTTTTTTTTEVTDTDQTSDDHHPTEASSSPPKPNPQQPNQPSGSPSSNPHPHPHPPSKDDTYNISIVVHSATVPNMDYLPLGRASDTYCDVFIDDVLVGSTPIIDNNNAPNWQYLLPKAYRVRAESTIRVDLLDRDHLKRDHIGGVVMLVGDLVNTNRLDRPVKFFHGRGDVWVTVKLV